MAQIPEWHVEGDWFDACKCNIPCPCTFAQLPTYGDCDGIIAYHVRRGHYGSVSLDGLNVMAVGHFEGNIWAGETKVTLGIFIDERADEEQRDALRGISTGRAPMAIDRAHPPKQQQRWRAGARATLTGPSLSDDSVSATASRLRHAIVAHLSSTVTRH